MKQLNIATESIAFQTGAFFKELTLILQDARASGEESEDAQGKVCVRIDQCVYKHTGITTNCRFIDDYYDNAFIILPNMARGNVLNGREFNDYLKKHFNADRLSFYDLEKKGWVDPANSRVGGALSEIVFNMYIGMVYEKKYTEEEIASIILHEVGHAYTFLQFMVDTVVVNTVLQRTYLELTSGKADKKIKVLLTKAADDMAMQGREWLEAVDDDTDATVAYKLLATAVQLDDRTMDNKKYFTQDTAEELAEIFAIRHGAGRALLMMRSKSKFSQFSHSRAYLEMIAWSLIGVGLCFVAPEIGAPIALIAIFSIFFKIGTDANLPDFTTFKQTATKIRNQFVEQIKTSKLPKEELVEIVNSIDLADKLIKNYKGDYEPSMVAKFFDCFRRGKLDARASREYTDILERLTANDLFVRAAQFGSH